MESIQGLPLTCPTLNIAKVIFQYLMWRNITTNHVSKVLDYFLSNQHTCSNSAQQTGLLTWQNACLAEPFLNFQITVGLSQWLQRFSVCEHGWGDTAHSWVSEELRNSSGKPLQASFYSWWLKLATEHSFWLLIWPTELCPGNHLCQVMHSSRQTGQYFIYSSTWQEDLHLEWAGLQL